MPANLPVNLFEAQILADVDKHPVVVIIGETGSGKTTQISQILYRAGYGSTGAIAVTQPRRVATVSVARRVASELDVQLGEEVGYTIRFEDRTSDKTRIKYLTDGCLLQECLSDSHLKRYSVIILDEAHERSLNTDILLGVLKRLAGRKDPDLRIIVTSATLDGKKFSQFFMGCPVLNIPGKMFPVEILYCRDQPVSYFNSAIQTVIEVHTQEDPGDILLFLTGQEEIEKAVTKLEERIKELEEGSCMDAIILPLHASLPPEMQVRIFAPGPPSCRRIIVATNIAETSVTVDGVVYVIDPGVVKQRQYSPASSMYSLMVVQISRVQAIQRAGRAGRTRPGKCYRLYTESTFNNELPAITVPEIQRTSLNGAVLHLKSLDLPNINVLEFDFLDPPSRASLEDALVQLYIIDAINDDGFITSLGRRMAEFPLDPSLSRTLLAAEDSGCLNQALTVVAMLSCESLFIPRSSKVDSKMKRELEFRDLPDGNGLGDHIQLLEIFEQWKGVGFDLEWCKHHGLLGRSLMFAKNVREQLSGIMQKRSRGLTRENIHNANMVSLRKAFCRGFANRIAQRMPRHNGYRTIAAKSQLVQIHPSSCSMEVDEDGLLPEWVVYNELINTGRPYIRYVCAVEGLWCQPALIKLGKLSLGRLSGGSSNNILASVIKEKPEAKNSVNFQVKPHDEMVVAAARERFLARKQVKAQSEKKR